MKLWTLSSYSDKEFSYFYIDISKKYACIEIFGYMIGVDF